jgi:hypothetical protein
MSVVSPQAVPSRERWYARLPREVWASVAITAMWLAVCVTALWGPDFISTSGTSSTTIPSGIVVAVFAYLGTRVVARYGFREAPPSA